MRLGFQVVDWTKTPSAGEVPISAERGTGLVDAGGFPLTARSWFRNLFARPATLQAQATDLFDTLNQASSIG